jgi:hypothetical protein
MTIVAGSLKGITQALQMQGFSLVRDVKFIRMPYRGKRGWICKVAP